MIYAIRHHRAVVDRISRLHEEDVNLMSDDEPIGARTRENAIYLLGQRPDLSIGMSVERTSSGALRMDLLRRGREYIIEIDAKGRATLMCGIGIDGGPSACFSMRSVNARFLSCIDKELPDPAIDGVIPILGELRRNRKKLRSVLDVETDEGRFVAIRILRPRFRFDMTCFRVPRSMNVSGDTLEDVCASVLRVSDDIHIARRAFGSRIVSLQDIRLCPGGILRRASLPTGLKLLDLQDLISQDGVRKIRSA